MRDVEVAGTARVSHECRRPAGHVGAENGGRRSEGDGPPCAPMSRDVGTVGAPQPGPFKEAPYLGEFVSIKLVEIGRKVDHAAQSGDGRQSGSHLEQLTGLGDGGHRHGLGQRTPIVPGDPDRVAAGHLPAMNPTQVPETRSTAHRAGRTRPQQRGPAPGLIEAGPGNGSSFPQVAQAVKGCDGAKSELPFRDAQAETGDRAGRRRVRKRHGPGIDDMQKGTPEAVGEESPQDLPIVHVEPFCRRDERAVVTRPGEFAGLQEEMNVQAGELAGLETVGSGYIRHPALPGRGDPVVTDIGGVAKEQRGAIGGRKCDFAIVVQMQGESARHVQHGCIGSKHERSKRVCLYRNQLGIAEHLSGRKEEAARAGTGVDDTRGDTLTGRPRDHGVNDWPRGVDRPLPPAHLRRTQPAEGGAKRIVPLSDGVAKLLENVRTRGRALGNDRAFRIGEESIRARHNERERRELALGRHGHHRLLSRRFSSHGARACLPHMLSGHHQVHVLLRHLAHRPFPGAQRRRLRSTFPRSRQHRPEGPTCKPRSPWSEPPVERLPLRGSSRRPAGSLTTTGMPLGPPSVLLITYNVQSGPSLPEA